MSRASSARGAPARARCDEIREPELREHLAVARRSEVDRNLGRELRERLVARLERHGTQTARRGRRPAHRGRLGIDRARTSRDALRRHEVEHHLVGVPGGHARHRRPERRDARSCASGCGCRSRNPWRPHLPAVVIGALAGEDGAQRADRLPHPRARCAPTRGRASRETITGLDAPSARSTSLPVSVATEEAASAIATGLLTPIASGPIFSRRPGTRARPRWPARTASKVAISPIHSASSPAPRPRRRCRALRRRAGRARTAAPLRSCRLTASRRRRAARAGSGRAARGTPR